ncbi:type II/IV secretion system protein [Motiliproteus coralliicola]|uniref:Type II/IV secretion system protein n=1 Tax=Motiliproteus coralliicola TaxID=2283196 RepID=A0A369WAM4_9GAMM|nr:GspE/PulE family protein [Motiliproteus coralliicola]RDE18862.1 type II/IV secretion system protein [Motiliproteus coralliicola]
MATGKKIRIGDLLVQNGVITEPQLMEALGKQKQTGQKLGRTLIALGMVTENRFIEFLSQQLNIPSVELSRYEFDQKEVLRLSEAHARRFRAIVLKENPDHFLIGMADPMDLFAFDELQRLLGKPLKQAVVSEGQLLSTLDLLYRRTEEISSLAVELDEEIAEDAFDIADIAATDDSEVPVVKLLQKIFEDAVQVRASDIHIEPDEKVLRIRQRIDGVLQEHVVNERRVANALVLRLKLMAELNISEKRLPQDGRFNINVKGRSLDVRISTMPIQYGESVVMRLLDQSAGTIGLDRAGLPADVLARFRRMIHQPNGLILVTGPTGSGKTTTLYGGLMELNDPAKKIITVEDPVEYRLDRINQVNVNPKIGLDFATVLRASLRQDPDILLVGEIRDHETATIAMRAAMTGHLVLSTLHTNDAISSAMRLIDIGIEGFMAATALRGVLAQRLVRRICVHCKQDYSPSHSEQSWLEEELGAEGSQLQLFHGQGCTYCNNTGYSGRIGIFELLEIDDSMSDALRAADTASFAHSARHSEGFKTLAQSALEYARQGVTTLEEVFRVTEQMEGIASDIIEARAAQPADSDSGLSLEPLEARSSDASI